MINVNSNNIKYAPASAKTGACPYFSYFSEHQSISKAYNDEWRAFFKKMPKNISKSQFKTEVLNFDKKINKKQIYNKYYFKK